MVVPHATVRFWVPAFEGDSHETSKTMAMAASIQMKSLNRNLVGTNTGIFFKFFMVLLELFLKLLLCPGPK